MLQSPVENDRWDGIRDATKDGSVCTFSSDPVQGSEDCLFVNVYSPSVSFLFISLYTNIKKSLTTEPGSYS